MKKFINVPDALNELMSSSHPEFDKLADPNMEIFAGYDEPTFFTRIDDAKRFCEFANLTLKFYQRLFKREKIDLILFENEVVAVIKSKADENSIDYHLRSQFIQENGIKIPGVNFKTSSLIDAYNFAIEDEELFKRLVCLISDLREIIPQDYSQYWEENSSTFLLSEDKKNEIHESCKVIVGKSRMHDFAYMAFVVQGFNGMVNKSIPDYQGRFYNIRDSIKGFLADAIIINSDQFDFGLNDKLWYDQSLKNEIHVARPSKYLLRLKKATKQEELKPEFEANGTKYKFTVPAFVFNNKKIFADDALKDRPLLATLVEMQVGFISKVENTEI